MALARAQGAPQADLADALIHRDQHDVHYANSADPEREGSDKCQQNLKADRQPVNDGAEFVAPKHLEGFGVGGREILALGDSCQHLRHRLFFKLRCDGLKEHDGGVTRVPKISRGGVRDP